MALVTEIEITNLATKAEDALGFLVAFHATLALTKELVSIATPTVVPGQTQSS